jgi:competence protein ComEC
MLWQRPPTVLTGWVPPNWQVASCDVGQGDATVIRVSSSEAIVIDVGGSPELINRCLTDLKVRKIALLLLTHFHADHVVGLPGALAGREVGQIRISPLSDPPLTTKFVNQVLSENQMKPSVLAYPEYLRAGAIELFCIWPKNKTELLAIRQTTPAYLY